MNKQRGFGLIEVLISMLVFALGAVALVKLQGELVRGGSNANARSVALSIAQGKLDDLRAFQCTTRDTVNNTSPCYKVAGPPTNQRPVIFDEIGSNTGGVIPTGQVTRGNTIYTLSWGISGNTVVPENPPVPPPVTYDSAGNEFQEGASARLQRVQVVVSWTEADGTRQLVTLEDQINNKPPANVALAMENDNGKNLGSLGAVDKVPPGTEGGVGTGGQQEQTTFDPTLLITQNDQFVVTHFETVTYAADTKIASRREENLVINCECKQAGSNQGAEPARDNLVFANGKVTGHITHLGAIVNKPVGERINTGQSGQQSELCDVCCKDHHDHLDPTNKNNLGKIYDPWRPTGNDSNGNPFYLANHDHSHFFPNGGVLQPANNLGDTYLEACRLQRVGGVFQVMQDWNLASVKVMPECFLEGGCPLGSGIAGTSADYLNYVTNFVKDYVNALDSANPEAIPAVTTSFNNEPNEVKLSANETMQMVTRAIYIDFLTPDEITKLQAMDSTALDFLGLVPFDLVNMTKLANWSTTATDLAGATNEPVKNDGNYSRGLVTALKGDPFVTATLQFSNTGFLGFETLLKVDEHDGTTKNDSLQLKIGGGSTGNNKVTITFVDGAAPNTPNGTGVQLAGPPIATCDLSVCTLDNNGDGQIQITGYNGNSAATDRKVCYQTTIPAAKIVSTTVSPVTGGGSSEFTTFTLVGATGALTLTIDIVKQGDATPAGFVCIP